MISVWRKIKQRREFLMLTRVWGTALLSKDFGWWKPCNVSWEKKVLIKGKDNCKSLEVQHAWLCSRSSRKASHGWRAVVEGGIEGDEVEKQVKWSRTFEGFCATLTDFFFFKSLAWSALQSRCNSLAFGKPSKQGTTNSTNSDFLLLAFRKMTSRTFKMFYLVRCSNFILGIGMTIFDFLIKQYILKHLFIFIQPQM